MDARDLITDGIIRCEQCPSGENNVKLRLIHNGISVVLSTLMLIGSPLLASEAVAIRSSDYLLGHDGVLAGSVLNQSGLPVSGLPVHVLYEDHVIATAFSDENGQFAVQGLRNGQHTVQLGASIQPVRFWRNAAAPPAALSRMAIVVDEEVVRGQCSGDGCGEECGEGCGEGFSGRHRGAGWGPALGILLIGGAVATTLALTLDDDDDTPASP